MLLYRKILTINILFLVFVLKTSVFGVPVSEKQTTREISFLTCQLTDNDGIDGFTVFSTPGEKPKGEKPHLWQSTC